MFHHHLYFYLHSSQMMKIKLNLPCNMTMIRAQSSDSNRNRQNCDDCALETNITDRMTVDDAIFLPIDFNLTQMLHQKQKYQKLVDFVSLSRPTIYSLIFIYGFSFLYANIRHTINKYNNVVWCGFVFCVLYFSLFASHSNLSISCIDYVLIKW